MRKILLLTILTAFVFTGCKSDNGDDDNAPVSKNLDIKIKTEESYLFKENTLSVITAPQDFIATVKNNEVKGLHAGKTEMTVKAGNVTYNCKIDVEAAYTHYVDMAVYLGQTRANIIKLYGQPIKTVGNMSLFGPLVSLSGELNNIFEFDTNGKVVMCSIYFPISSGMSIVNHLKARYETYTSKDYTALMGDSNTIDKCNTVVLYEFSDSPVSIMYFTKAYINKQSFGKSNNSVYELELLSQRLRTLIIQN